MGGFGSGGWNSQGRATTAEAKPLDANYLRRTGALRPGSVRSIRWTRAGEPSGNIMLRAEENAVVLNYRWQPYGGEWRPIRERVRLIWRPCRFGGERPFFVCPGCGDVVMKLYGLPRFLCRGCNRLAYASQRERPADRASRRADKIRARLGCEPGWGNFPVRPKGMWLRTYSRLLAQIDRAEVEIDDHAARLLMRLHRKGSPSQGTRASGGFWR